MPDAPAVYLSNISHVVGDPVALDALEDTEVRKAMATLADEGLVQCRVTDASVPDLAGAAASTALGSPDRRTEPDTAIYCSDTPTPVPPGPEVWRLNTGLGLPRVPVLRVAGGECGNLGLGLRVARAMVMAEGLGSVLLVTADRSVGDTRYLPDGLTVLSDGAAACLVTAEPPAGGFAVHRMAVSVQADAVAAGIGMQTARTTLSGISRAVRRLFADASVTPEDCRYLVTGNYGTAIQSLFAAAVGLPQTVVRAPLREAMGHCFSADVLMNLETLRVDGELDPGDRLLLLTTGSRGWTVTLAEYLG
ncbi:hypothetical protein I0C86_05985 [Plantactinospora sp. S1510]|uniref:Beta-ketoacyl-[acyl-carrier-protein] synthase III C-terminal domain-containing protein n=1 Tax=Plantactinospora alkalitolerans TaxID=2789879 RepID=A0ABS0GQS3_9ACTN|nr:3-oxoacyl-[acyl-carrier-protein] synthase III C-terminal domain-containing protein [Plantactinospora alkalitolerans]MBF9128540.1 hypothetical protein [Plantactinospora alkalitolerans]